MITILRVAKIDAIKMIRGEFAYEREGRDGARAVVRDEGAEDVRDGGREDGEAARDDESERSESVEEARDGGREARRASEESEEKLEKLEKGG